MFVNLEVVKALEHWEEKADSLLFYGTFFEGVFVKMMMVMLSWEGELRSSSSSACIFFSVSLWLIPAHASPLPLLLTQYIALPYTYYKGYIPTSSQSLSCRCQWTPMDPCPQHKIIDNLVIVTKMSTTLPISMFLLEWINNMSRSTSSNQT